MSIFPAVYDDIMENLRIRYVITYVSSNPSSAGPPRSIRVDLIDPKTGQALKIRDASGKPIAAQSLSQETFTPNLQALKDAGEVFMRNTTSHFTPGRSRFGRGLISSL